MSTYDEQAKVFKAFCDVNRLQILGKCLMKKWRKIKVFFILGIGFLLLTGCAGAGEAQTYILPNVYTDAQALINDNKGTNRCEDIYLNEDGSLTLVLTEKQRKSWADPRDTERIILPAMKMLGISIEYSDDYTELTCSAPGEVAVAAAPMIRSFAWEAELIQILGGAETWSLKVTVINKDTGEIEQQVTLPEEELDWSFLEEGSQTETQRDFQ